MGRRRPKKTWPASKKLALKMLGRKRLSPTKMQRTAFRKLWKQTFGYEPARLSSQVGEPSRHVRKGIRQITDAEGKVIREEFITRRLTKGGQGKSGGSAPRESHRTGSAAARAGKAKTRGMKARKEKRKKKKR